MVPKNIFRFNNIVKLICGLKLLNSSSKFNFLFPSDYKFHLLVGNKWLSFIFGHKDITKMNGEQFSRSKTKHFCIIHTFELFEFNSAENSINNFWKYFLNKLPLIYSAHKSFQFINITHGLFNRNISRKRLCDTPCSLFCIAGIEDIFRVILGFANGIMSRRFRYLKIPGINLATLYINARIWTKPFRNFKFIPLMSFNFFKSITVWWVSV